MFYLGYMINPVASSLQDISIVCFSHLRWGFVYQRPQHLMSRFAKHVPVYFIEEPVFYDGQDTLVFAKQPDNVTVITPHLSNADGAPGTNETLQLLVNEFLETLPRYCAWYYTPMALAFTRNIKPYLTVYDCMDELSAFKFAPPALHQMEKELMAKADVVFTGGYSIYHAKKNSHHNIHPFPSSIDKDHFGKARSINDDPADQQHIPHPRLGFFGVIDERFDITLVAEAAQQRPEWQFVLIGPVVKIDADGLPKLPNIHYMGGKNYNELPTYLAGWDIALIPFADNESTKFISPTKTPEYLAGGKPVISTPIADVVDPYGKNDLVYIVRNADELVRAAAFELSVDNKGAWLQYVDEFLKDNSWDNTWQQMVTLMASALEPKQLSETGKIPLNA